MCISVDYSVCLCLTVQSLSCYRVHLVCLSCNVWKSAKSNQYMTGMPQGVLLGNGAYHMITSTCSWLGAAGARKGLRAGTDGSACPWTRRLAQPRGAAPEATPAAGHPPGPAPRPRFVPSASPPPPAERRRSRPLPGGRRGRGQSAPAAVAMRAPTLPAGRAPRCAPPRRLAAGMDRAPRGPGVYGAPGLGSAGGLRGRGRAGAVPGVAPRAPAPAAGPPAKSSPRAALCGSPPGAPVGRKGRPESRLGGPPSVLRQRRYTARNARGAFGAAKPGGWCRACRRLRSASQLWLPLPCWGDRATPRPEPRGPAGFLPCHRGRVLFSLLQQEETCGVFFSAGNNA